MGKVSCFANSRFFALRRLISSRRTLSPVLLLCEVADRVFNNASHSKSFHLFHAPVCNFLLACLVGVPASPTSASAQRRAQYSESMSTRPELDIALRKGSASHQPYFGDSPTNGLGEQLQFAIESQPQQDPREVRELTLGPGIGRRLAVASLILACRSASAPLQGAVLSRVSCA